VVDGSNDWSNADNELPGSGGSTQKQYLAWDADKIYFASQGSYFGDLTPNRYWHAYFRSTANGGTNTGDTVPVPVTGGPNNLTDMTLMNVHFYFSTDGSTNGVRVYTAAWGTPVSGYVKGTDYDFATGGFGTANAIVEYWVTRAQLGYDGAGKTLYYQTRYNDPAEGNTSDGRAPWVNQASNHNWGYVQANLDAANVPTFPGNFVFP
jgi:hypothetical protein